MITPFFDATLPSGGALHSMTLAEEWLGRGRQVAVLCAHRQRRLGSLQAYADTGQLELHVVATEEHVRFSHHLHPEVGTAAAVVLRTFRPDVVHVHNFQGLLSAVRAAVDGPAPVVLTALDYGLMCFNFCLYDGTSTPCAGPESPGKCAACIRRTLRRPARLWSHILPRWLTRRLWPRFVRMDQVKAAAELQAGMRALPAGVRAIIAPSPHLAAKLAEFGGTPERITHLLYGLRPEQMIRPAKEPSATLRLAYLGGTEPIKGFQVVADAAGLLPDDLPLVIRVLGGNALRDRIERSTPAARRYLRHEPPRFGAELAREHARFDAVLVPSLVHDNSPFVVLEALAAGTAVLAADQAGIRHLIEPERTGRLIPPAEPRAWAEAMTRAARDPACIHQMQARTSFARTVAEYTDDLQDIEQALLARSSANR